MCLANANCVEVLRQLPLHEMIVVIGAGPSAPGCCMTQELVEAVADACQISQAIAREVGEINGLRAIGKDEFGSLLLIAGLPNHFERSKTVLRQ